MPHRIGKHEDIGLALTRLAVDDLAAARATLVDDGPPAPRVHRVRRRLKRTKSIVRVLRPAFGARAAPLSGGLRDAARLLAAPRDTDVAAATARNLMAVADGVGLERVVAVLDREAECRDGEAAAFAEVEELLAAIETEVASIDSGIDGEELLVRGLARSYRRGRIAMQRATFSLATPDLHAWRKAAKDLWHLIRIARKRLPANITKRAAALERLSETLGLDHDHAMLAERLALSPEGDPALMQKLSLIAEQRLVLESEAFALGARLYRQKPKKFRRHIRLR